MDATAVEKQVAALREADAVVAGRLAELDRKLAAWLAAMGAAQAAMRALAEQEPARPVNESNEAGSDERRAAETRTGARVDSRDAAGASSPAVETPVTASRGPMPTSAAPAGHPAAPVAGTAHVAAEPTAAAAAARPSGEKAPVVRAADAGPADAGPAASGAPAADRAATKGPTPGTDAAAEDEALLAQLDPETANALRVKRRLTGNRKSIRQLLEEMQAGGGPGTTPGKGKRWWR